MSADTPRFVTVPFNNTVLFVDIKLIAANHKADAVRVDDTGEIYVLVGNKWKVVGHDDVEDLSHWKVGGSE